MELGDKLRQARLERGWDQAELAKRLSTGQQTVSKWERGGRPSRKNLRALATLLEIPLGELLVAAGYDAAVKPQPVRPLLRNLPLADLSPEQFEHFMTDLGQLVYPSAHVSRFGSSGYSQDGIDIIGVDGGVNVATWQCKRHKEFGPKNVREAIEALAIDAAEHWLVLSRVASPAARKEIGKYSGWRLVDVEDISRIVRQELDLDAAVRLVDTYFPGWREDVLGVSEPGVWQTVDELYGLLNRGGIYSHEWPLIGRVDTVDGAVAFACASEVRAHVALLVGRGGIGKSRVLRAIADACVADGVSVRFLASGGSVAPHQYEVLPAADRLLVIVDDVHERQDVAELVSGILRQRPKARVLLGLRPYGLTQLGSQLRSVGLHPAELPSWELSDLTQVEAEQLAREVLGANAGDAVVRRLAALTTDCPLVTVVGAGLMQRGQLDPARLEAADSIRTEILQAFRDALVADPSSGDPGLRSAVLDAVALLQPFRIDETDFQDAISKLTGIPFDRAMPHIRSLEGAGVFLRRGKSLRIVPDLLGDVVLADATLDVASGATTGYIERARTACEGRPLQHLFVNASRIDWQIRRDAKNDAPLAKAIWADLEAEFKAAGILGRLQLAALLKKVGFYQPDRALDLVRWAIGNPTDTVEERDDLFAGFYTPTYEHVLRELPPVLKLIAYNLEHLKAAVDELWELAQADDRAPMQNPDHALRQLQDLASYEPGKPLGYNIALLDAAQAWFAEDAVLRHSPFDVIEQLLATEGTDESSDGRAISFRPFAINVDTTAELRQRVVSLALEEARSSHAGRASRAIAALEQALRYPTGLFGRPVSDEERARWTPRFVELLDSLAELGSLPELDPTSAVALRKAVNWHAQYSDSDTRGAANRVIDALPTTPVHDLALFIHDGWGHLVGGKWQGDYQSFQDEKQARTEAAASRLLDSFDDEQLLDALTERLLAERLAFGPTAGHPMPFCWTLFSKRPSLAGGTCARVESDPESALVQVLAPALAQLLETDPTSLHLRVEGLLATESLAIKREIAQALGWYRGDRPLAPSEGKVLLAFAADADPYVRNNVVRAAQLIATAGSKADAIGLIAAVAFADTNVVAAEVCGALGPHGFLRWDELGSAPQQALLAQLVACPRIEDYEISALLSEISKTSPYDVVTLLRRRVEHAESLDDLSDYSALPFHWDVPLHVAEQPNSSALLRQVRDWIAEKPDSWRRREFGGDLFGAIAPIYNDQVLVVLEEAMYSSDRALVSALAAVLKEAPKSLVWERSDFIERLLAGVAAHGDDAVQEVGGALHGAVISGGRSGVPGQPFPEDIEQRDRAAELAMQMTPGSWAERFYRSLQQSAERSIDWSLERDIDRDGRDW